MNNFRGINSKTLYEFFLICILGISISQINDKFAVLIFHLPRCIITLSNYKKIVRAFSADLD